MLKSELRILSSKNTPEITLNPEGIINIRGRSMIANVTEFSGLIEDWMEKYICNPAELTRIDFHLEYLNTNNLSFYISLLGKIASIKLQNKKYVINWYYEEDDEDILDKGESISSILDIPFNFIIIPEQSLDL